MNKYTLKMHASEHTYNQTCTCLCSTIKLPEHKQHNKPREMEEERRRDREVLKTKDMEAEGNGDREIKDVIVVQKIKGVRFIVRVR